MPTEYPACREADSDGSNPGVEAPWIEPASRSASEPVPASLHNLRAANLPDERKPDTRREEIFTSNGGPLRGERGQRAGKVGLAGWEAERSGDRLPKAARRVSEANQTSGSGFARSGMRRMSNP